MKRLARTLWFVSLGLWLFALFSPFAAAPAYADVTGNCEATFKGVDIRGLGSSSPGDAIDVDGDEAVVVTMTSAAGFASHTVELEIAGVSRTVSSKTDDGDTEWSETVKVKDYAWMGAGLYKVTGSATLSDGSACSGSALINVTRFPLTTVAGGAAAAGTVIGLAAMAATSASTISEGNRGAAKVESWVVDQLDKAGQADAAAEEDAWTSIDDVLWNLFGPFSPCLIAAIPGLLLTVGAMATPGDGAPTPPPSGPRRLRRARWRPRITLAGIFGGLLAGVGIAVLLQQFAVQPLTAGLLIALAVAGVLVGIIVPSLLRFPAVAKVNSAIARAEERLRSARPGAAS